MNRIAAGSLKLGLALVLGIGAGMALMSARDAPEAAPRVDPASLHHPLEAAPTEVRLEALVLVAGAAHDAASGRIALASGTRFRLQMLTGRDGMLELYAINPAGVAAAEPLWTGPVKAGQSVSTPGLRLEGRPGLETLRLVLRAPGQGVLAQRRVQIWHL